MARKYEKGKQPRTTPKLNTHIFKLWHQSDMMNRQHCRPPSLVPPLRSTATSRNHLAMIHGKRDDLINDNDNKSHWRTARRPKPRRPSSSSSGQLQSCWSSSSSTSFSISSSPCFSLPSFMAVNGLPSLNTNTTTKTTLLRKQHPPRRWRSEETCLSSSMLPLRFNLILVILVSIPLFGKFPISFYPYGFTIYHGFHVKFFPFVCCSVAVPYHLFILKLISSITICLRSQNYDEIYSYKLIKIFFY